MSQKEAEDVQDSQEEAGGMAGKACSAVEQVAEEAMAGSEVLLVDQVNVAEPAEQEEADLVMEAATHPVAVVEGAADLVAMQAAQVAAVDFVAIQVAAMAPRTGDSAEKRKTSFPLFLQMNL